MPLARIVAWFTNRPTASERALLDRCRGDRELLERLIRHEHARRPDLSRAAAAASANDRWQNER